MAARPNSTTMDGSITISESHAQLATLITATRAVTAQQIAGSNGNLDKRHKRQPFELPP